MSRHFKFIVTKKDRLYVIKRNLIEDDRGFFGQMDRQKMLVQYDELIVLKSYTQTIADLYNFRNP
jgi:hypothetical protein